MKPGNSSSLRSPGPWRTFHPHKQLCLNISSGLCFKQASTGNRQPQFTKLFPASPHGVGKKKTLVSGYHTGQHLKMPVKHVPSCCTVAANELVQESVNAVELESDALGCANVKADVSIMMKYRYILQCY